MGGLIPALHSLLVSFLEDALPKNSPLHDKLNETLSSCEQQMHRHRLNFFQLRHRPLSQCLDEDWVEPSCEWVDTVDFWPPLPPIVRSCCVPSSDVDESIAVHSRAHFCSSSSNDDHYYHHCCCNPSSSYLSYGWLSSNSLSPSSQYLSLTDVSASSACFTHNPSNFYSDRWHKAIISNFSGNSISKPSFLSCNYSLNPNVVVGTSFGLKQILLSCYENIVNTSFNSFACSMESCFDYDINVPLNSINLNCSSYLQNCPIPVTSDCHQLRLFSTSQNNDLFDEHTFSDSLTLSIEDLTYFEQSRNFDMHRNFTHCGTHQLLNSLTLDYTSAHHHNLRSCYQTSDESREQSSTKSYHSVRSNESAESINSQSSPGGVFSLRQLSLNPEIEVLPQKLTFFAAEHQQQSTGNVDGLCSSSRVPHPFTRRKNCVTKRQLLLDLLEPLALLVGLPLTRQELSSSLVPVLSQLLSASDVAVAELAAKAVATLALYSPAAAPVMMHHDVSSKLSTLLHHSHFGVQLAASRAHHNLQVALQSMPSTSCCRDKSFQNIEAHTSDKKSLHSIDALTRGNFFSSKHPGYSDVMLQLLTSSDHTFSRRKCCNRRIDDESSDLFSRQCVDSIEKPVFLEGIYPVFQPPGFSSDYSKEFPSSLVLDTRENCDEEFHLAEIPVSDDSSSNARNNTDASTHAADASVTAVDIVLLHGVLGGAAWTWRQRDDCKHLQDYTWCWPQDWLCQDLSSSRSPRLSSYRVIAVNCDEPTLGRCYRSVTEEGRLLLERLTVAGVGREGRRVLWLTHSRGGLLLKAILAADEQKHEKHACDTDSQEDKHGGLLQHTAGVVFLSTPHLGVPLAPLAARLYPNIPALRGLYPGSQELTSLHNTFLDLQSRLSFPVLSVQDTFPLRVYGSNVCVVPVASSDAGVGRVVPLDVTHLDICKPEDRASPVYKVILDFALRSLENTTTRSN